MENGHERHFVSTKRVRSPEHINSSIEAFSCSTQLSMKFQMLMKAEILFLQTVYAIEKLLAGFNVQPRIGMNQSLV